MSWITVIWSMLASVYLTFAMLHLFILAKGIRPLANLSFTTAAFSIAAITGIELIAMRATSIEQLALLMRWVQLPVLVIWVAIFCFVCCYFNAGRSWLALTGGALRVLALILGFATGQNLFFDKITGLEQVEVFGGETISIAQGTLNPWYIVGPLSTLALAVFVLDAAKTMWRKETTIGRRRAILFGGSIIFFLITAPVHTALVNAGIIASPFLVGLSFMPILLSMSYELSCDLLHSIQLAQELRLSEAELRLNKQRMRLAASAADLRLWEWDIVRDKIWSTDESHQLFGTSVDKISFDSFLNILYPDDREPVRQSVEKALSKANGQFESEYRIKMPDDQVHWLNSRGRVEFSESGEPLRMLDVTMDITRRKQAELEVQRQRNELTHLARVNLLGELSGSLAHELNQPLTSILSNAQAAQRFLARDRVDLAEVKCILDDIVAEDKRASEVIRRLRLLLKKGEVQRLPIDLNKAIHDVLRLVNSDLVNHNIKVNLVIDLKLPTVTGDRVQLQQVLLNLILNASEAMSHAREKNCRISVCAKQLSDDKVQVSVTDQGPGIPTQRMERIFEPFVTTKSQGMGLGLTICRSIITAHGGELWAANNNPKGATFYFTLPVARGENA